MSLEELKQQRASIKKNISRIKNLVESSLQSSAKTLSAPELKCRLGILDSYFKQVLSTQTNIEKADSKDEGRTDLEDLYITTKILIQAQLSDDHNTTIADSTCIVQASSKLPQLKLPSFCGKYSDYKNFISSFKQIIDREHSLSNIEKFNHLRNCLQGPALETIDAFQVSNENYTRALERLQARYDNPTLIFLEGISALFELSSVSKGNGTQLRSLIDKASAIYGSLLSLGTESQISQAMLIFLVLQKADEDTNRKWKESLDFKSLPTWDACASVLERHCQFLDSIDRAHDVGPTHHTAAKSLKPPKNQQRGYSFACSNQSCVFCSSNSHKIHNCERFKGLAIPQRFENVKKMGLCINCLSKGHQLSHCSSSHKCRVCSRQHHTLLHRIPSPESPNSSSPPAVHTHLNKSSNDHIILATAMVLIRDAHGSYRLGRALLDSCSQVNFITDELSQKLLLPRNRHNIEIHSIGKSSTNIKYTTSTNIKSQTTEFELPLTFCITSHIAYQPEPEIDTSSWKIPSNILLADNQFYKSKKIDLLLGTESFFSLLSVGQIKLGNNLPILQKTLLGWVVSGRYQTSSNTFSTTCLLACDEQIDKRLERLWQIENVSTTADTWTPEQHSCEKIYNDTVTRSPTGRIVVKLPFKNNPGCLGDSYATALRRFISQERRLSSSPSLRAQYVAFMDEYASLGHMSVVQNPNLSEPHYYIPHHCVLRPSSTSTKLRVVFDASCRTTTQKSVNDIQMVGPTIQNNLITLLLRFRLNRFALTADIVKMYRQVLLSEEHRKFQYILWRSSPHQEMQTFQLNTVTYGMASAPYLAIRSLHYLADHHASQYTIGANIVKSSFYVDDLLCGADTLAELSRIKYEVTELLKQGEFELAKWHSNHQSLRLDHTIKDLNLDTSVTSALGLKWEQIQDNFQFCFKEKQPLGGRITKRSILSTASSLFDPLGLLAPVVVAAKILLQELWLLKVNWDESVPQNVQSAWLTYVNSLSDLVSLKIPRYCLSTNITTFQIHGFCDASIRAYGCGIYTRIVDHSGVIRVCLFTAKSRVAPTKRQSLPKLELCGALLLARLFTQIKPIFTNYDFDTYLWTDSQIVLHWLRLHSATLSPFVGNRVSEIQDSTANAHWKHVPTKSNPADIVSRGSTPAELYSSIWLTGPEFLYEDISKWPKQRDDDVDMEIVNSEMRKSVFKVTITNNYILETLDRYSSHTHQIRLVAWILRFGKGLKKGTNSGPLTADELHHALLCIIWNIQQQHFADDIRLLQKKSTTNGPLRNLNPFLESTSGLELLKVGGRLELADLPENQKHPLLLPSKCEFVSRYVRHLHLQNYHAGPKALVALIRLQFWIINARDIARRIVRSCTHCVRYKPKLLQHMMGNLPVERLTPSRPFSRCGVDFCGPINVYLRIRGKGPYKVYIAIYVCFATKAVHIEVVSDLSTDAFLASLKRMIGRRGLPSDIFCDNATNFVGACRKLAELKAFLFKKEHQDAIVNHCANEFINFHFIPPRAPHFGGIWEAAVKSAKGHLQRTTMNARLTYEELTTVLIDIEAVLNSRPISPLSSDPSDYEALTPGHFLTGSALKSLPERVAGDTINHFKNWDQITTIKQKFWTRWSREYISELQTRIKWSSEQPNIAKDALVLIHEDNLPPQRWKMGRVVNVIPGKDARVRVVDIRTSRGIIQRPIRKIAVLPVF